MRVRGQESSVKLEPAMLLVHSRARPQRKSAVIAGKHVRLRNDMRHLEHLVRILRWIICQVIMKQGNRAWQSRPLTAASLGIHVDLPVTYTGSRGLQIKDSNIGGRKRRRNTLLVS